MRRSDGIYRAISGRFATLERHFFAERAALRSAPVRPLRVLLFVLVAAVLLAPAPARAQQRTFYLDRVHLSGAPDDGFLVWRPYISEKTRFYGMWALGYTNGTLRAENLTSDPATLAVMEQPISHQLITYLSAGMELASRVGVNLTVPVALFQAGGEDPQELNVGGGLQRDPVAVHDTRLDLRIQSIDVGDGLLRMGGGVALWLATGNSDSFASDDQGHGYIYGSAEFDFDVFIIAGNIGPHFRPSRSIGGDNGNLALGRELRMVGGAYLPLREDTIRLGGEIQLVTGLDDEVNPSTGEEESTIFKGNNTDFEWLAQARFTLDEDKSSYAMVGGGTRLSAGYGAPNLRLLVSVGSYTTLIDAPPRQVQRPTRSRGLPDGAVDTDKDGFPDDIDLCPTVKEDGQPPNLDDGCPAPSDRDKDGIPDDLDKCPDDPEDMDGLADHDGCPEEDFDNDKILDVEDKCPTEPGVESKEPEKNGCPSLIKRKEGEDQLVLLEPIQFETGKSTIKKVSFPVLDEVVAVLNAKENMRLAIHGHTDNRGRAPMNLKLSKDRAAAVVEYLIGKGIDGARLESDGFGIEKPIDTNDTAEGRAKNRRVEFKILGE